MIIRDHSKSFFRPRQMDPMRAVRRTSFMSGSLNDDAGLRQSALLESPLSQRFASSLLKQLSHFLYSLGHFLSPELSRQAIRFR